MAAKTIEFVERLRRPEYTGGNRCTPCTILNVAIAGAVSVAIGVVGTPLVGASAFGLCLAAIYLRGYLVPGTPAFTKRYFPDWVLARFDKADFGESSGTIDDVDPEAVLTDAGVVEPCERVDDLCLADWFREEWNAAIDAIESAGTEAADLSAVLGADETDISVSEHGGGVTARLDGRRVGQWASRAALVADLAAARLLSDRYDGWTRLGVEQQSRVLSGLRVFLDSCPECGGEVTADQETVESCCRRAEVIAVSCADCDARLLEVEQG